MTYGTRIKQAREDLRLTQEQLAEQLDISRQAVSKWEAPGAAGAARPNLDPCDPREADASRRRHFPFAGTLQ